MLHHGKPPKPEDQFETAFNKAAKGGASILRGKFGRYAHDKVLIVSKKGGGAVKVLTGSTNFSVTGLYVNSNHVLLFNDAKVASTYAEVFQEALKDKASKKAFAASDLATQEFSFSSRTTPQTDMSFAPHSAPFATKTMQAIAVRIAKEGRKAKTMGSVLFATMQIDKGKSPVYDSLNELHKDQKIFSYGISDSPKGIYLYKPGSKNGVLQLSRQLF
jgi:hypothetical protein